MPSGGPATATARALREPERAHRGGAAVISGRTHINDRAICPSAAFPDLEIQEHVPDSETIVALRISLNLLGDGFVEMVPDESLTETAT